MGFTRTSEGRVFFKNADNDDIPRNSSPPSDPVMPADSTQMQILLLLKSLNSKLKSSREDHATIKTELKQYKATIKGLEDKTTEQETNYIDLEQNVARKQNEASKKSSRVESSIKTTLKQLEEAKNLVQELEDKIETRDDSLETLKEEISEQRKKDGNIIKRQKSLEEKQKEQGEKMVSSVATYVALTKRVNESETRQESLDNKIEDATSEYLKLDRKIDKAIEDRNRILRKVDRIEQAVLETRDALNAKAMVLLTDQGAVAGVNMPEGTDEILDSDPSTLNRRLQEEALMPWWRRPLRIQSTSLALMMIVVLLLGWIMSEARHPAPKSINEGMQAATPTVALHTPKSETSMNGMPQKEYASNYFEENTYPAESPFSPYGEGTTIREKQIYEENTTKDSETATGDYGITIHKGYGDPREIPNDVDALDINNEEEMLAAFEDDPNRVAQRLNQIEPASLTTEDRAEPPPNAPKTVPAKEKPVSRTTTIKEQNGAEYIAGLRKRIKPDPNLTEIAKKIENQAFEGVPEAQHDMGAIYVAGHGQIKKDLNRAVLWFKEAAQNGVANAKYNLGVLYHQGLGVEQSITHAMTLYDEAADLGHPEAQYNLGIANIEGIGVPYNPKRAARFFEMSANEGVTEAAYNLGLIYENGLLGETRPDDALAWYKKAADQGSPEAQSALEQLADSLGISINDVNRIVGNLQKTKKQSLYNSGSASSSAQSYLTSQIQKELMRRGLYPGPVDGMSGPMTENAIKRFQQAASLDINGQPTQELLSYMETSSEYR